jgi:hypothetical protein
MKWNKKISSRQAYPEEVLANKKPLLKEEAA